MRRKYEPFKGQKFDKLHKHCRELDTLFNDPIFPASVGSLGAAADFPASVEWRRPGMLVPLPRLLPLEGAAASVLPGPRSSSQVSAALAVLAGRKDLLSQVVPGGQAFPLASEETGGTYAGIFHFRFWRFGRWQDVVVDDLLPCVGGRPLFSRCVHSQDMWLSLAEKAYAKLHGSYSALALVSVRDALVDFTAGVSEWLVLGNGAGPALAALARSLLAERATKSLLCCSLSDGDVDGVGDVGEGSRDGSASSSRRSEKGLLPGRHYVVTDVKKVHLGEPSLRTLFRGRERVTMVLLRDPLAVDTSASEGEGGKAAAVAAAASASGRGEFALSAARLTQLLSSAPAWAQVSAADKHKLGLALHDDHELWMPLEDFAGSFSALSVVRLLGGRGEQAAGAWRAAGVAGSSRDRAGGNADTLLSNPQFLFDVQTDDMEVTLQLLQWDANQSELSAGIPQRLIGLSVIKVELNRSFRLHVLRDWTTAGVEATSAAARRREVGCRRRLARGRYVAVPFTGRPGQDGCFLLRAFAAQRLHLRLAEQDAPSPRWCGCLSSHPQVFTVVHVRCARGLPHVNHFGSCDPYCEVRCEGATCRTHVVSNTRDPDWNVAFVFLRRHLDLPLDIRVWSHNAMLRDAALGRAALPAPVSAVTFHRLELSGVDDADVGSVELDVFTDDHLTAI